MRPVRRSEIRSRGLSDRATVKDARISLLSFATGGAVGLAALALVAAAGAKPATDPGVTVTSVLLGGTVPLTGEAAAFGTVAPARRRTSTT
jgi:hypothetical protein